MAMVLSSQSRLIVAICFTMLVLAGALTIGSLTGWFTPVFNEPIPAKLSQAADLAHSYFAEYRVNQWDIWYDQVQREHSNLTHLLSKKR